MVKVFDKILNNNLFSVKIGKQSIENSEEFLERRQYQRFQLGIKGYSFLDFENDQLEVIDISYGGINVSLNYRPKDKKVKCQMAKLVILGKSCPVKISEIFRKEQMLGLSFHHEGPEVLLFLREYLERLRFGNSMQFSEKSLLIEKFQSPEWIYLRGEGPSDLVIRIESEKLPVKEMYLTFRQADKYYEISFHNGNLKTGQSIDQTGVGARLVYNDQINPKIVRYGVSIIAGISHPEIVTKISPVIDYCRNFLQNN